jgi:hypothetical protein
MRTTCPGLQRRPKAPEAKGDRGHIAPDMEPLSDGKRRGIDANYLVVLRRFVFPDSRGAGPDRASPDRRVDGPDGQPLDAPDRGGLGIGLQQAAAVRIGHIDTSVGDHDPVRTKVQALSSDDLERGRSILTSQPAWSATHSAPWPKAMLCGLPRTSGLPTTRLVLGFSFETVAPPWYRSSSLPVQTEPAPNARTEPK